MLREIASKITEIATFISSHSDRACDSVEKNLVCAVQPEMPQVMDQGATEPPRSRVILAPSSRTMTPSSEPFSPTVWPSSYGYQGMVRSNVQGPVDRRVGPMRGHQRCPPRLHVSLRPSPRQQAQGERLFLHQPERDIPPRQTTQNRSARNT